MENWLKALVATACVVIIAGGAYGVFAIYRQNYSLEARSSRLLEQIKTTKQRSAFFNAD